MQNTSPFLKSELDVLYGEVFRAKTTSSFLLDSKKLNTTRRLLDQITFYEESFFWTFKRFYLTLGLTTQTNQLSSMPYMGTNPVTSVPRVVNTPVVCTDTVVNFFFQPTTVTSTPLTGVATSSM